jgi:hypothetical protein
MGRCGCHLVLLMLLAAACAVAQERAARLPATASDTVRLLRAHATMILVGRVESVEPVTGEGVTAQQVTLLVESAVRGVRPGQQLRFLQWAGLEQQEYRTGERWLLFLHRPSAEGFASPVGGELGRVPIVAGIGGAAQASADLRGWRGGRMRLATLLQALRRMDQGAP